MPRYVDQGVTRLTWVPGADGIADINAPTLTELGEGRDLTCLMLQTYEARFADSDTTQERAVCETANVDTPTVANYMGRFELFRQRDELLEPDDDDVLQWLHYQDVGYLVRRVGRPNSEPYEAGQALDFVARFMADNPQSNPGTGAGHVKATVPMLPQGAATSEAVVTDDS